ncbi:unnamed protein product [Chrysoparadoxa australica]
MRQVARLEEQVAAARAAAAMAGTDMPAQREGSPRQGTGNDWASESEKKLLHEEFTAKLGALKSLLDEKNASIDRLQRKLDEAREINKHDAAMERGEMNRLSNLIYQDNVDYLSSLRQAVRQLQSTPGLTGEGMALNVRLMEQVEEISAVISEKDETNRQLELKLRTASNQRERAETRCGETLEEMDKMKSDMIALATQLEDAEERALEALEDTSGKEKIKELRKALLAKEGTVRGLRTALVKLKEEFVAAEEAREEAAIQEERERRRREGARDDGAADRLAELKEQVRTLKDGLAEAKQEMEELRRSNAKIAGARSKALEENDRLSQELAKLETAAGLGEDEVLKLRREAEAFREREETLRRKLRDANASSQTRGDRGGHEEDAMPGSGSGNSGKQVAELEKRIRVLTAQNAALRSASEPPVLAGEPETRTPRQEHHDSAAASERHKAWAVEKRLKRRIDVLEQRLAEKVAELEVAEGQAGQARDLLTRANKEKEALARQVQKSNKSAESARNTPSKGLEGLEPLRARLFELEEENAKLKRTVELEHPQQVEALTYQVREVRGQLNETATQLEQCERRLKAAMARRGGGASGGIVAEEEELFHEAEALRDELNASRADRRELEGKQVLDRDAAAMELRFDLEASTAEKDRLRGRLHELEHALHAANLLGGGGKGSSCGERTAGGRFKRERDLEGVVEALKRVVEKLRAENDRLRRGAAHSAKTAEVEKRAREAKSKVTELQGEVASLRTRAAAGDDAIQRLAQKQDLINQLKRQLKGRDEDLKRARKWLQEVEDAKAVLATELEVANRRQMSAVGMDRGRLQAGRSAPATKEAELAHLRDQLAEAERERQRMSRRVSALQEGQVSLAEQYPVVPVPFGTSSSLSVMDSEWGSYASRLLQALRAENEQLKRELGSFTIEFFEEIEDLKYKYSLAVQRGFVP